MNYDSLRVIKWCCDFSFAVPFNFIRFLFSILCIIRLQDPKMNLFKGFLTSCLITKLRAFKCKVNLRFKIQFGVQYSIPSTLETIFLSEYNIKRTTFRFYFSRKMIIQYYVANFCWLTPKLENKIHWH